MIFDAVVLFSLVVLVVFFFRWRIRSSRLAFIEGYRFNTVIGQKVQEKYPHLDQQQIALVLSALKDYFYICSRAKNTMVSMPSQVVDVAWHEFILFTRQYQLFCRRALGRFLHHTPTEAMRTPTMAQDGIKRAWRLACAKEQINPATPFRLPLLFAIDAQLGIEDGFKYSLNCKDKSSPNYGGDYCACHIGCSSGCAGGSGAPSSSGGFFGGVDGDSSGCSGGGCGGCGGS